MKIMDLVIFWKITFLDLENFSERNKESQQNADSENEEVGNLEWFSAKDDVN